MKLADYSQAVTADELDAALRAGQFDGVWHYTSGSFALRIESPDVVAAIRARGWPQGAIDVPRLQDVDGRWAAATARRYGYPDQAVLMLDVEPDEFRSDPESWVQAGERWCDDVRASGLTPCGYGTDVTVAACFTRAEVIVRAVPGMCDPDGPGLAASFLTGHRGVQCANGTWAGVEMDVTYTEFDLGGVELLSQGLKVGLSHAIIAAIYNREPTEQELFDLAGTMNGDASNLADLVQGLANELVNADVARIQPSVLAGRLDTLATSVLPKHHHDGGPTGPAIADP